MLLDTGKHFEMLIGVALSCTIHGALLLSTLPDIDVVEGSSGELLQIKLVEQPTLSETVEEKSEEFDEVEEVLEEGQFVGEPMRQLNPSTVKQQVAKRAAPVRSHKRMSAPRGDGRLLQKQKAVLTGWRGSGAEEDYVSKVLSWLDMHKRYPRAAQRSGYQGEVVCRIVLHRNGSVEEVEILRPSRHDEFNREVLQMIRRSTPFPAIPDQYQGMSLVLVIPIQFMLEQ